MKKNKMMRLAAILLVGVLFTTSVIGGTFAKYVTEKVVNDDARVAKFGVVIEATSFGLFETDYETTDDTATFTGTYSVSSEDGINRENLLAPGTSGSFADIAITGTPEVAVDVAIEATVLISDNWIVDGDFYCPIVVTVGGVGGVDISGLDYDSATDFADAIEAVINGKSAQYAPNTDLSATYANTNLDLAWAWPFSVSEANDMKDTDLGDKAVAEDLTIDILVDITVTQID